MTNQGGAGILRRMAINDERVPLHWGSKGHILKWAKGSKPVKNIEGKYAFSWCPDSKRVLLWSYTLPPKDFERVPSDKLKAGQGVMFVDHVAGKPIRRLQEGSLADYNDDLRALGCFVDSLRAMECHQRGQPDPWGNATPENTVRNRKSMRSYLEHRNWMLRFLGRHLYEWIANRDSVTVGTLAKMLTTAKGLCMSDFFGQSAIWHNAESLRGTVYRCFKIMQAWDINSLPSKRGLRDYVLMEWEAMGNRAVTVETEFSGALKSLGLSKLPNGPREKSVVPRAKRRKIEK